MSEKKVTIIDYGMGNIWSVLSALHYLGIEASVSEDPDVVSNAEILLLPGVGSFRKAMIALESRNLGEAITQAVTARGSRILGICLGMQLLGGSSSEDGETLGLGLIPARVDRFAPEEIGKNKVPHIGFDVVASRPDSSLFKGLAPESDFYFVHSYRMLPKGLDGKTAICRYGVDFLAAYEHENIYATQFHPEKSQTNGLMLLKNFLAL